MATIPKKYTNAGQYSFVRADGVIVTIVGRRHMLVSSNNQFVTTTDTTRLDNIAYSAYGDSASYWAVADQSFTLDPFELTENVENRGQLLLIPSRSEITGYEIPQ